MKKIRANNKQKLASIAWTDDAIEEVTNRTTNETSSLSLDARTINSNANGTNGIVFVDTQEDKIARVQMRKEEAELRLKRKSHLPPTPPKPETVLSKFYKTKPKASISVSSPAGKNTIRRTKQKIDRTDIWSDETKAAESPGKGRFHLPFESVEENVSELSEALNTFFGDLIAANPWYCDVYQAQFSLSLFDSSVFDESLRIDAAAQIDLAKNSVVGSALVGPSSSSNGPATVARVEGVGTWHTCRLLEINTETNMLTVEIRGLIADDIITVPRMHVILIHPVACYQDVEKYADRMTDALRRRYECISLIKYYSYIYNMPVDKYVTSSMTQKQFDSIYNRAASNEKLRSLSKDVALSNINEAQEEFEVVMNKLIFDANMLSPYNELFYQSLRMPVEALGKVLRTPLLGLVAIPVYNFPGKLSYHRSSSYLNSPAAVGALHSMLSQNFSIMDFKLINIDYTKTFTWEKFERYTNEQLMQATRHVKQDWPSKSGAAIRSAITKAQDDAGFAALNCVVFDLTIRNVFDFEQSKNQIKSFLERHNLMMSDILYNMLKRNLLEYTALVEDLCGSEVTVMDVKTIKVQFPPDSIYKRKVLPPLFSIAFRVAAEEGVLNQDEVDAYNAKVIEWKSTADDPSEKCPIPPVKPIRGRTFEYNYSLEQFKTSVAKPSRLIIQEFSDVPHVQKYVMDKIYFPKSKSISSVKVEEPWVQEAWDKIDVALEKAVAPLRVYLAFFKKYETFVNINNDEYIASRIAVKVKDPESQEIDLPVVVDVSKVFGLINEHLQEIEDIERSLPIVPIECGLFVVEVGSVRALLLEKHRKIIQSILSVHASRCAAINQYLDSEFKKITSNLSRRSETIEELTSLNEYMDGLPVAMTTLQTCIGEMMTYQTVLDTFKFKVDHDTGMMQWTVFGAPQKIAAKCEDVLTQNAADKQKFAEEMKMEQNIFQKSLVELSSDVAALVNLTDINDVTNICMQVKEVEAKLAEALSSVKQFNSRETLFDVDVTEYEDMNTVMRNFTPHLDLWQTAKEWLELSEKWMHGRFVDLDADEVERLVEKYNIAITKALKFFTKADLEAQISIASKIKAQVALFVPEVPMIVTLRNKGMRDRHWQKIAEQLGVNVHPIENFTTEQIIALNLKDSLELIQKIGESAAKEYQIEQALDKMEKEWENMSLQIHPYKETGTGVLKGVDDINVILDEQITMTQTIMFSAFKGPFEERIDEWNRKLCCTSDVLEVWVAVQRNWLYLQPIFDSADINRQLPTEGKKFSTVDKTWRTTITAAKAKPKVVEFCDNTKLLERFRESEILLDQVQKGLSDYLETKRSVFARFYFLSNDELLSILSESKDVKLVQPHLKKCFEGIDKVKFLNDLKIDRIISPEGEEIILSEKVDPVEKNVEVWMVELEQMMKESIKRVMGDAIVDYTKTPRPKWMQKWAGMCVLNGSQMHWTTEMETYFREHGERAPQIMLDQQIAQLSDMTILVRGKLSGAARTTVGALTVIDVHARDVIMKLVDEKVADRHHFSWTSQLRYYWENDLTAQMVAATRPYGYEYLGNSFRLVITPLTDKCYLTLMGALQMIFGGAPAGPAGTGKTETTKDLAKALAMQCVVFNCSDGLDFIAMGKFFKGLAACGAWACFDEFNRINIEVLSVIGQQIMSIQQAVRAKEPRMNFEGSDIAVSDRFAVFITMNPGYAGRSALPDSLQALFRPVAMMVPDYALIGEIMFFAYGFEYGKECGAKMVTTFKLCSEQLSAQPHYDYGMRAVKTVITAAGNLKRAEPEADEMVLLLRALQDVNIPKFLEMDLPLYAGIISDLFPGRKRPDLDYGHLMRAIKNGISHFGLQPVQFIITKVIQLYEMIVVRHGMMLVGPTGGGKSSNLHILEFALGSLKDEGIQGFAYEHVKIIQLNPKSITMGQMYGEVDSNTMEWKDGIMSTMYRGATVDTPDRKWIMFDGPVDAIWIENMNTVLDDNKKLCLNSGEIIKMSSEMSMMFEVEDLTVASPATVSRVGIIYMEPRGLGLDCLMQSWLDHMPKCTPSLVKAKITYFFDLYLQPSISFVRTYLKELVNTVDNNLAESLLRILDCYLEPYREVDGRDPPTDLMVADLVTCIEPLFVFALVWSVGATVNEDGRMMFDQFLRQELFCNKFPWMFPKGGMVYDFLFLLDTKKWIRWMDVIDKYEVDVSKVSFNEIIVPTTDSVRNTYLMDLLLPNQKHMLVVGGTGTGKTININQYLMGQTKVQGRGVRANVIPIALTFSANTSANMTQDLLDAKMDKRRKGVYGPAAGKVFYVYVDDLNMPKREEYGAQPPIELLRQWFDQDGWYDRKDLSFRKLIDLTFVSSMGPPGGGRQEVTNRFLRHFNIIGYVEMSDVSKQHIFGMILNNFLGLNDGGVKAIADAIVSSSIDVFSTICRDLLPTPSKSHYTFNLRDLAKVFQGMLMVDPKKISSKEQVARLWIHENKRVFADRFTCAEDHEWLDALMKKKVEEVFGMNWEDVYRERLLYGDFMGGSESARVYDQIEGIPALKTCVEEYLISHNGESKQPMPLVMFSDALEHVVRIARVLRQPQGNALLLGVGGSGRQSMTKLATYIANYSLCVVEIVKGYSMNDWRDDLKRILMQAGVKDMQTVFLFSDVQIIDERMVEDINNILNAGDVPNLYAPEDLEAISTVCKIECQKRKIPATKLNVFSQYIARVRKNIHMCVAMSPLGEAFRNRLRNYPALVNCCTIDWFTNWPADALQSVGLSILKSSALGLGDMEQASVVMFKMIHLSVEQESVTYYEMLRRRNYVTPTSYLELLSSFGKIVATKRSETSTKKDRLQIGLDKLSETKKMVSVMQEELTVLQPVLVKTQAEVEVMMIEITKDKASAAETKATVEIEEAKANKSAASAKEIADDAQKDLAEAIPALEEAVKCLNDLKKADIDEVKSLKTPPGGVVLTIKVCCFMFEVKPIKKADPNNPGKKIDDYWDSGKKELLADAKVFIESLKNFDKDNIPDRVIKSIAVFMDDPAFTPAAIEKASKACTAVCMWARAMYKYHFVALGVAPKRAKLKMAEDELKIVMEQLAVAKATLKEVNDKLATLEAAFNEAIEKKDMLEKKEASCKTQLINADKLIGGLGGEETRWTETVETLKELYKNVLGDVIVSAASISYLGPFTMEFRQLLVRRWQAELTVVGIPHTKGCDVEQTLADPVKVRSWQICNLPSDSLSTQNAIIMDNGRRWPLFIDPQGQANRYIRSMAKDKEFAPNGMDVCKLSDKNFLRTLENGIQFGRWILLENIFESLDAALEPILLQQTFKQGGQVMMKVGDNIIPYNDTFKFFLTTKLSNPHYAPEVQVKVSLLNFTITQGGLEEQLLGVAVQEELPELSAQKANLVVQNAANNKQLYDIESEILYLLSNSTGNILDDTVLIETLAQSKITSEEIKVKMNEADIITDEIRVSSELYRPVAKRASLLYFVIADLSDVDPMYQYSLQWYTSLFIRGIAAAKPAREIDDRIFNLNEYFTYSVYVNICRSLFEKHKLLFAFILCIKILQGDDRVDGTQYRFLLSGISPGSVDAPLPDSTWLQQNIWTDLCVMAGLPSLARIPESFTKSLDAWQAVFDDANAHSRTFPAPFDNVTPLERLCILRCLRRDKIELCMQDFIVAYLDDRFIQPPPFDLKGCYNDSLTTTPLIFVLSSGSDPNKELDQLADDMSMGDRLKRIALGQGQGKKASSLIDKGMQVGDWVMLQNCHLSISWMPVLEQICESFEADKIHPEFRLWLTSMPSKAFPTSVLQNGVKITKEAPKGLRANLKNTYIKLDDEKLRRTPKVQDYQRLLFGLAFYHALVVERKKFGPLGWNIPYEFNDTDKDITISQLEVYVSIYDEIPFKVLQQLTSVVNYGGRITDDKDMRTSDIIIADFFLPSILDPNYKFSASGKYYSFTADKDSPHQSYLSYIEAMPLNAEPEVFGMHDNANITVGINDADDCFATILTLQPRVAAGGGISREDQIIEMASQMGAQLPPLYDIEGVGMLYPTDYFESMNTVLVQEGQRYNKLLACMHSSLRDLQKALKGLVVLSSQLEAMGNACFDQRVPDAWTKEAYPSLKPLGPWFKDLMHRLGFVTRWIEVGTPPAFWISGFFFPQGFLTAILQNYARKHSYPIDTVAFSFLFVDKQPEELTTKPEDGCYIHGLFFEGTRWSEEERSLVDPKAKELFSPVPPIHMMPVKNRETPQTGIYRCPVYKVLTRTGVLSTTGHSTNFVTWIEVPSNRPTIFRSSLVSETNAQVKFCDQDYWVKAGVACFCALRY